MSRPPTLETVAERAGVSRATVSRVVNGDPRVADRLRASVEQAIGELGFVPNHAARSLATRRTGSVALIVGDDRPWPMARGVRDALAPADLQLVVLLAGGETTSRVAAYARHHADGVLLLTDDEELTRRLADWQVPMVAGTRLREPVPGVASVTLDDVGAGRLAAQRLLDAGRRRLAVVTGSTGSVADADREAGFRRVTDVPQLVRAEGTAAAGEQAMRGLLHTATDGVFVTSDVMALGVLRALAGAGRRVPDDVAVVGFGDTDIAAVSTPTLTTIRVPWLAQARRMVELLVDGMAGRPPPASVVLEVELVGRESA